MSGRWAVCPVCAAVVADIPAHQGWHADVAGWATVLAAEPLPGPVTAGPSWPPGHPVLPPPANPEARQATATDPGAPPPAPDPAPPTPTEEDPDGLPA